MAANEPSQKKKICGLAGEMWLKIETQCASNAADVETNCMTSLYNFKHDSGNDIVCHINVPAFTNRLREIRKLMAELHIINIITSPLPESYAIARSGHWKKRLPATLNQQLKKTWLSSEQQTDHNERMAASIHYKMVGPLFALMLVALGLAFRAVNHRS
ncbi:hypothetical protein DAPPUDRAFT_110884 [Daphnia pulex]|uniref:Uncharacterized protein n=1 Tax=Daphnia pulex TaxID=6669 RepID=E9H7F8_DAPPU|nr:hypothetical protein DAPPUDRAFT_110884 [Daphnia pulex]|eukprot:EFX72374.1 hypothetical protein DAPPUDRAFT_110884 [Daphnia pulex]